ncbi:PorV/PorQ family protein [candidate division KSB1 bacterium]|nr:PorV/PorQ family protein [candidate division KSB1 bacterium]
MKKITLFFAVMIIFSTGIVRADFSKVGTSAAQFLKIGIGARAMGMGETFVAVANDVSALYWNPAGLTNLSDISLIVSRSEWFAGINHDFAGLALPWGRNSVIGISAVALNVPEQEVTTIDQPDGTGIYYDVGDIAIGLSYARGLTDRFSTGITAKFIQQNAYNETANTFALDIGTTLRTGYRGLVIAMCMSNFGGRLQLDGRDLIILADIDKNLAGNYNADARLKTESYPLPLNFRVGLALDIVGGHDAFFPMAKNRFTLAIDGNHPNDNTERVNIGCEYTWNETIFARGGYKINYDVEKWAFGAGLKFGVARQIMSLDYAMVDFGDLGKVSRFSVELAFK